MRIHPAVFVAGLCVLLAGCGEGSSESIDSPQPPEQPIASCAESYDRRDEVLAPAIAANQACEGDADCTGVFQDISRDGKPCMANGCVWSIAMDREEEFRDFLANDSDLGEVCRYQIEECPLIVGDCQVPELRCVDGACRVCAGDECF